MWPKHLLTISKKNKAGKLTIVDLSCPCVPAQTACSLFNICLSLFLEQESKIGRVVALDEAHKFMGGGTEGATKNKSGNEFLVCF